MTSLEGSIAAAIDTRRLHGVGDSVLVRDARGRSSRPALVPCGVRGASAPYLSVRGPFSMVQRFQVEPADGWAFARASRDENPLHTRGKIVPGAMIAARVLLLPEILLGGCRVKRARLRFRALAFYGVPAVNLYRIEPDASGALRVEVRVRQAGSEVAEGQIELASGGPASRGGAGGAGPEAERIRSFLESLRVEPALYFERVGAFYPRAYLAALPSGEMVRQYSGGGGLLNVLDLEFPGDAPPLGAAPPTIELRESERSRKSFHKILARIAEGIRTCCSGFAMVLPGEAADRLLTVGM